MQSDVDQFVSIIKQIARDDLGSIQLCYWGYISSYDPKTNSVQVCIPALRYGDTGNFVTPPMPLGVTMSGNGYGFQHAPAVGTPCQVSVVTKEGGASVCTVLLYNDLFPPPFTDLATNDFGWMHKSSSAEKYAGNDRINTAFGSYTLTVGQFINLGSASPTDFVARGTTQNNILNTAFELISAMATATAVAMTALATNVPLAAAPCTASAATLEQLVIGLAQVPADLEAALSTIVKVG